MGLAIIVLPECPYVNPNDLSAGNSVKGSYYAFVMDSAQNGLFSPSEAKQKQGNRLDLPEGGGQTKTVAPYIIAMNSSFI